MWMKDKQSRKDFEFFTMRTYGKERPKLVHDQDKRSLKINADWSEALLRGFQDARISFLKSSGSEKVSSSREADLDSITS